MPMLISVMTDTEMPHDDIDELVDILRAFSGKTDIMVSVGVAVGQVTALYGSDELAEDSDEESDDDADEESDDDADDADDDSDDESDEEESALDVDADYSDDELEELSLADLKTLADAWDIEVPERVTKVKLIKLLLGDE